MSPEKTSYKAIGNVISDGETPTFEIVRIRLKAGQDIKPGTLVKINVSRTEKTQLFARIRSGYEKNPDESAEKQSTLDTFNMKKIASSEENHPDIYRLIEADLIEEIIGEEIRSPQNLPNSGAEVFIADSNDILRVLGLEKKDDDGLYIGETVGGIKTQVILKREAIQRHLFIGGTTGSGKSYAMGVVAEEIIKHKVPVIFIDTQDEYSTFVDKQGGKVVEPGEDFTIRISSLTESEFIDLLPDAMKQSAAQCDVAAKAFGDLQADFLRQGIAQFTLENILDKIPDIAKSLSAKKGDEKRLEDAVKRRISTLKSYKIFGSGYDVADWEKLMYPCIAINCKKLTSRQLQSIATAVLRELQSLRLRGLIPPYVAVIDEAHLFVPQGESSPCKQIIREGVRIGRHHGICMVLMTQSPVDIDKSVIRQCNTRLVFALEADQLDAIKGVKADASEEMLRALPKMPRGTCLLSGTYESIKHTIPVQIRQRKTEDSEGGKTPNIFQEMTEKWLKEDDYF